MSHEDGTPTTPTPGSGPWPTPDQAAAQQPPVTPPAPPAAPAPAPYVSGYEAPASTAPAPAATPYGAPQAPTPAYTGATGYPAAPAAPAYPGAPTYPGAPGAGYGATPYPGPTPGGTSGTDGVSIAALVTGVLLLGIVPIVLGIIGLGRTRRNGTGGRGMAIAGIVLGALEILASIVVGLILLLAYNAYQDQVTELRAECAAGEMASCDELYRVAWSGSDDEWFGDTCGGLTSGGTYCTSLGTTGTDTDGTTGTDDGTTGTDEGTTGDDGASTSTSPYTYGDDPTLDAFWDGCAAGDMAACDDLYSYSPIDSAYEDFANTCGNRIEFSFSCEAETF
jgi:hypothetical protein